MVEKALVVAVAVATSTALTYAFLWGALPLGDSPLQHFTDRLRRIR